MRDGTVVTIAGAGFLLAARAADVSGATNGEAALSVAASDDARCCFCGGADPENGFSLEGMAAGRVRVDAARVLFDGALTCDVPPFALGGGVIDGSGGAKSALSCPYRCAAPPLSRARASERYRDADTLTRRD